MEFLSWNLYFLLLQQLLKNFLLSFNHLLSQTITAMLPIFSTLQIVNLGEIIMVINTTRATIFTIATITTIMAVNYGEKSVIFVAKKVVALINIKTMSNKRQKNFGDKTENFVEIRAKTTHFWLIMKGIQMITLIMSMKKQIIQKIMMKIVRNMSWLPIFLMNLSCIS